VSLSGTRRLLSSLDVHSILSPLSPLHSDELLRVTNAYLRFLCLLTCCPDDARQLSAIKNGLKEAAASAYRSSKKDPQLIICILPSRDQVFYEEFKRAAMFVPFFSCILLRRMQADLPSPLSGFSLLFNLIKERPQAPSRYSVSSVGQAQERARSSSVLRKWFVRLSPPKQRLERILTLSLWSWSRLLSVAMKVQCKLGGNTHNVSDLPGINEYVRSFAPFSFPSLSSCRFSSRSKLINHRSF
jgi:hypothetical protein